MSNEELMPKTKKSSECKEKLILPWAGDVALMGPDTPPDNGMLAHLIQYLVTVRERFGNTMVREDITLQWGSSALWKADSQKAEIVALQAKLKAAEKAVEEFRERNNELWQRFTKAEQKVSDADQILEDWFGGLVEEEQLAVRPDHEHGHREAARELLEQYNLDVARGH